MLKEQRGRFFWEYNRMGITYSKISLEPSQLILDAIHLILHIESIA